MMKRGINNEITFDGSIRSTVLVDGIGGASMENNQRVGLVKFEGSENLDKAR